MQHADALRPFQGLQTDFAQLQANLHSSILQGGLVAGVVAGVIVAVAVFFALRGRGVNP